MAGLKWSTTILAAFGRGVVKLDVGGKLFATFLTAGLPSQMINAGREDRAGSQVYNYCANGARGFLSANDPRGDGGRGQDRQPCRAVAR